MVVPTEMVVLIRQGREQRVDQGRRHDLGCAAPEGVGHDRPGPIIQTGPDPHNQSGLGPPRHETGRRFEGVRAGPRRQQNDDLRVGTRDLANQSAERMNAARDDRPLALRLAPGATEETKETEETEETAQAAQDATVKHRTPRTTCPA